MNRHMRIDDSLESNIRRFDAQEKPIAKDSRKLKVLTVQ